MGREFWGGKLSPDRENVMYFSTSVWCFSAGYYFVHKPNLRLGVAAEVPMVMTGSVVLWLGMLGVTRASESW